MLVSPAKSSLGKHPTDAQGEAVVSELQTGGNAEVSFQRVGTNAG